MTHPVLSLSVVSHGQLALVEALLGDIQKHCDPVYLEVLLTLNIPEEAPAWLEHLPFALKIIRNQSPQGFGRNHNHAFEEAKGQFFCVVNPDIRMDSDVFPALLAVLNTASVGVVAPMVVNAGGSVEDSARRFPTPLKILGKVFWRSGRRDYAIGEAPIFPDWVGGMFMLFRRETYQQISGFNEKFFLYYEDVDLCARIWLTGLSVVLTPHARVTHEARRSSHEKAAYLAMHIRSMMRFFLSGTFCKAMYLRRTR